MDYPPIRGGVARYLFELQKASEGKMEVWVPEEHPGQSTVDGRRSDDEVKVKKVNFWWTGWPKWLPLIKRCLEVGKENVILSSHVFPVGTAAWIASMVGGPEYCVLFHGTDLARVKTRWKRWLLRRIAVRSKALFVNSQATGKALERLVSDARFTVVTPGVNSFDGPAKAEARQRLGVAEDAFLVLSVCRLVERKGVDTLIQAVSRLKTKEQRLELAVVGQGPYANQLHKLAELLGVNVRWVEDADDDEVKKWYAAADLFCLPAREQADDVEGFGIVFLEAAAAGLPVIAGKGWGTGEAVIENETGLLVEPTADKVSEALERLLNDSDTRKRLGEAGRRRAEKDFKWRDRWHNVWSDVGGRTSEAVEQVVVRSDFLKNDSQTSDKLSDIAIVVPCHNNAAELQKTLEALAAQSLRPYEVLVVDNLSDDHPEAVVNKFMTRLPIKVIRLDKEKGAPAARNYGYALTHAPYVLFLDADTVLEKDALQTMRLTLEENPQAAFAYPNFYWGKILFSGQPWDAQELKKLNFIHTTALARRQVLETVFGPLGRGPFDQALKKFQDWDLWLTLSGKGFSGVWINKVLFSVTQQKNGISHWLPAFVHKLPWPILGWMPEELRRYREAEKVIREKHGT